MPITRVYKPSRYNFSGQCGADVRPFKNEMKFNIGPTTLQLAIIAVPMTIRNTPIMFCNQNINLSSNLLKFIEKL